MSPKQRQALIKKQKHTVKQKANAEKLQHKAEVQSKNHLTNFGDVLAKLNYYPDMTTQTINHHYQRIILPMIEKVHRIGSGMKYNHNDNRTLFTQTDFKLLGDDDYVMFSGLVFKYKMIEHDTGKPKVYLLINNVYALVNQFKGTAFKQVTDHLWIDINDWTVAWSDQRTDQKITVGIGDRIEFFGHIKKYKTSAKHGNFNHMRQTKYGIEDIAILDSGYPHFKFTNNKLKTRPAMDIDFHNVIQYNHHQNYLIQYHQTNNNVEIGEQFEPEEQVDLVKSMNTEKSE